MSNVSQAEMTYLLSPELVFARVKDLEAKLALKDLEIEKLKLSGTRDGKNDRENHPNRIHSGEEYSEYKSNGVRKPHAAQSIRSYSDFKAMQDYFLDSGRIRDYALWTVGVCLGLRISDLLSLKIRNVLMDDLRTFRDRIKLYEKKTGKAQNCLLTEGATEALRRYFESIKYQFDEDDFVFASKKTGGKMYEEYGWKIISDAGKACGLPINVGSHTMRKSFANIAACADSCSIDMNAITKIQGLLNHGDQKTTMKYLGSYQLMFDKARIAVSDFVLGRTGIEELVPGDKYTIDDIMEALEKLIKN